MKIKRILSMVLAMILVLSAVPAVHAEEFAGAEIVSLGIVDSSKLQPVIWNEYYANPQWATTACGVWNAYRDLEFRVYFADGTTKIIGITDSVNGEMIVTNSTVNADHTAVSISFALGDSETEPFTVAIIESPVDHIEIVSMPDALVAGEHPAVTKYGYNLGLQLDPFNSCYEGLSFRVYYKDGTSELINHEDLEFGEYDANVNTFNTFPVHNGYSVEVLLYYADEYNYYTGNYSMSNPVPMYLHYMGQVAQLEVFLEEGPVAKVVTNPSDVTVQEYERAYLTAGITGPDVTYQWQWRENESSTWKNLEWAVDPAIYLNAELRLNGFQYRCVGTDENGCVAYTEPATLTVTEIEPGTMIEIVQLYDMSDLVLGADDVYRTPDDQIVYIAVGAPIAWLGGFSLVDYIDAYGEAYFDLTYWDELLALMDQRGLVILTADTLEYLVKTITGNPAWGESLADAVNYLVIIWNESAEEQKNGWIQENGNWYFYENGVQKTGWLLDGGVWYYLNNHMVTGWQQIDGLWYYFNGSGAMQTGWQQIGGIWYYLNSHMVTGWQQIGGVWYYFNASGAMQSGWVLDGGVWYYLNNHMVTGWQQIGGVWYYFNASGAMQSGWVLDGGVWYYLNNHMQTGWQKIGGVWYYFNASGAMQSGWQKISGNWYYLNNHMITGWLQQGGVWYYLGADGAMVTGTHVIDGVTYYFDASGAWIP